MLRFKTVKTIISTLSIAAAIGFVAQYGETTPGTGTQSEREAYNQAPRSLMLSTNAQGQAVFGVPNTVAVPSNHAATAQQIVAVDAVYPEMRTPFFAPIMALPVTDCPTTVSARREAAALVVVDIASPCESEAAFVVAHSGLRVAGMTDRDGGAQLVLPALVADATFDVTFSNIWKGMAKVFVPELRRYDRAVLQWATTDNMRLHALENGAQIGDPGHVWSASLHSPADARAGKNGFVLFMGDSMAEIPYQAEVYTFPVGQLITDHSVDLRVGVPVTSDNCGREVDARTIQAHGGEAPFVQEITIQMPACEQTGDVAFASGKFINQAVVSY